ncbi:hypothetical protein Q7P37_009768 [Cladosporium fusiforme]
MNIQGMPYEILNCILSKAAAMNEAEGVHFTYGLSHDSSEDAHPQSPRVARYIRGPVPADSARRNARRPIGEVCSRWHAWGVSYDFERIYEQRPYGYERWADLTACLAKYPLYELNDSQRGIAVPRNPHSNLKKTAQLLCNFSSVSQNVRRLWFNNFYAAETDRCILSIIASCPQLESLTIPWTILRRGTPEAWVRLLKVSTHIGRPLLSLEVNSACLAADQVMDLSENGTTNLLEHPLVDFGKLRRFKLSGWTTELAVSDSDIIAVSRTATSLDRIELTETSSVSTRGLKSLLEASRWTIKMLQYSPVSYPTGSPSSTELRPSHFCLDIHSLPKLRDLEVTLPSLCASLFLNRRSMWTGKCLIRFDKICGDPGSTSTSEARGHLLQKTLDAALDLMDDRKRLRENLRLEISNGRFVFDVNERLVHSYSTGIAPEPGWLEGISANVFEIDDGRVKRVKDGHTMMTEAEFIRALSIGTSNL